MAAMIASKRGAPIAKKLLEKMLLNPARALDASTQSAARSFNTSALREADDDERTLDVDRRRRSDGVGSPFFSGVFDPFNTTRSLSQVLNLMDQMMDAPSARGVGGGARRGWDAREDENALHLRIDMPGLGREDVKVSAEQGTLIIRGEGGEESEGGRRYSSRIELPEGAYKMEQIRAEMKNGVLRVTVPKATEEERKDVFQVQIE